MFTFYQNSHSQIAFDGRMSNYQKLENVRKIFHKNFGGVESPTKYKYMQSDYMDKSYMLDMNYQLLSMRNTLSQFKQHSDALSYYKEMINLVKSFKFANCFELASIGNLMLQINKMKSDVFALCKKGKDNVIRPIDHELVCINVPKSKNNANTKKNHAPFKMDKRMRIVDFWLDGKILNVENAKKVYKRLGINSGDEIYLMPIEQSSINKETLPKFQEEFKDFLILKKNSKK